MTSPAAPPSKLLRRTHVLRLTEKHGAGISVAPGDHVALAEAIITLSGNRAKQGEARAASSALGERFRWDRVLAPLERFVDQPHTRNARGETGVSGRRRAAIVYSLAVAGLGIRHGLWRRALGKLSGKKH